jgi:hypothetical protein
VVADGAVAVTLTASPSTDTTPTSSERPVLSPYATPIAVSDGKVNAAAAPPTVAPVAPAAPSTSEGIAENIVYQTAKSSAMPLSFDTPAMYRATAESVREQLLQNWNATYKHFHEKNPKQAYYISMEFLQGRALTNAIGNMGLTGRGLHSSTLELNLSNSRTHS